MKNKKIAIFFGGKITHHLRLLRMAARKLGVGLDLVSYNRVCFEKEKGVFIRGDKEKMGETWMVTDYDILFFRTTGKHWEEVSLILDAVKDKQVVVVDPLVKNGRPSDACKAYQMLELGKVGIGVPKTVYGSLWYLYEFMKSSPNIFNFPVILKGSGGDRGTRVFKIDNLEEMEKMVRSLRKSETEEGKRYMLQEFIVNNGDYRLLILGDKVLGVMKRSSQSIEEFRNNYSMGGKVEVADLPESIKNMAVEAARVCGLMVAGVDIMPRYIDKELSNNPDDYVVLEVNKGPQFKGFMEATGIDVPREIIRFLSGLKVESL